MQLFTGKICPDEENKCNAYNMYLKRNNNLAGSEFLGIISAGEQWSTDFKFL